MTVIVGPGLSGLQPPLSGLEEKVVRLTGMMEHSVRSLEAGMVDILRRIYHSREIRIRKVSVHNK